MKTATLPSIRVEPELRSELEAVLAEGESLSTFVKSSVRRAIEYRRAQAAFHARGQAALEDYRQTGITRSTDEVLGRLQKKLDARRKQLRG